MTYAGAAEFARQWILLSRREEYKSDGIHKLWLNITSDPKFAGTHHYHIVALALEELQRELTTEQRAQLLQKLHDEMNRSKPL